MPTTYAIPNGRTAFDATTWTGASTATSRTFTGLNFQPDLVWGKIRSQAYNNQLYDSNRGVGKALISNATAAEDVNTASGYVSAFNSDGFSTTAGSSDNAYWNKTNDTYVAWQWQAGQGTNLTNTTGSITSTVSANTTTGFSIVTWTSTGANATIGHGLSTAPQMIIVKARNAAYNWATYHVSMGNGGGVYLNLTNAYGADAALWQNTTPTSSVFSVGINANVSNSGQTQVAYCWAPVAGFSQFGSYTGNGSTDGPFVYLGFRPKFVMWKRTDSTSSWTIYDTTRSTYNATGVYLVPDSSGIEGTYNAYDFLSNGVKIRGTDASINASGGTYIYAAFAENPFKYANAR